LAAIVNRCLHKSPADRFKTMTEVKAALVKLGEFGASTSESYPSIAVLPFSNVSGDKDNEYFSDGMAEEIINALTKIPGLKVAARTSSFAFKGRSEDIKLIGQTLGMAHILEGSVRKAANRVRITAELIAVADGCHLWSERYDREMTDIFDIQDEIAQAIVSVLKVKLTRPGRQIVRQSTANLAAHQAYLEGSYYFQQLGAASIARSVQCFERAIELDPNYAAPHAGLAEAYLYLTHYEPTPMRDVIPKALATVGRAIDLDPSAAEGYNARGLIRGACQYQWDAGSEDFDRALQLNPDSSRAHYRRGLWYLMPLGRMDEAAFEAQRAAELNPLSPLERALEALMWYFAGSNEQAIERCHTVVEMFPAYFITCMCAGLVLAGSGELDEAEAILEQGLQNAPGNPWLMETQAAVYARQGKSDQVTRIKASLEDLSKRQYVPATVLGIVCVVAGELDLGFDFLVKALDERQLWNIMNLRAPLFVEFLSGPRHDALLRKMNIAVP
jgi:serine/threonine-protein kinase